MKKRKSQEKAREERSAEFEKKKKVGLDLLPLVYGRVKKLLNVGDGDDTYQSRD